MGEDMLSGLFSSIGSSVDNTNNIFAGFGETLLQNKLNKDNQASLNAYNSPVQQMQRLKAAGLNPALMYSMGNVGNQSAPVQTSAPHIRFQHPDILSKMLQVQGLKNEREKGKLLETQNEAMKAGIERTVVDTLNAHKQGMLMDQTGAQREELMPYFPELARSQNDFARIRVRQGLSGLSLNEQKLLNLGLDARIKDQIGDMGAIGLSPKDPVWMRVGHRMTRAAIDLYNKYFPH